MQFGYSISRYKRRKSWERGWNIRPKWYFSGSDLERSNDSCLYELSFNGIVVGSYEGPHFEKDCDYELSQAIKNIDRNKLRHARGIKDNELE